MENTEIIQKVDTGALIEVLRKRGKSLNGLAKELGISTSTFHRWVMEDKSVPQNVAWEICTKLDLSREETDSLLMVPKFQAFFRRRFLGSVPEDTKRNAVELAKTYLNLSTLHSNARFSPTDLSKDDDSDRIAEHIRRYFQIAGSPSLKQMLTKLREAGIEVGFIGFSKIRIESDDEVAAKEDAFSVTDQNRYVIFCNTESVNVGKLSFVVAHELAHLFRRDAKQGDKEEKFCNAVATEIIYPKIYFLENRERIQTALASEDKDIQIALVDQIVDDLGGEFYGVALRLKELELLNSHNRFLIGIGVARSKEVKKLEQIYFQNLQPDSMSALEKFWDDSQLASHPIYHFHSLVKRGLQTERMTTRTFSALFELSFSTAERLARAWRAQFQRELATPQNG